MGNVFFTADTHFNHAGIIHFSSRPFENTGEMNERMIQCWNHIVKPDDTIYHLGDFAFGRKRDITSILERLNGRKYLCIGSHDGTVTRLGEYWEDIRRDYILTFERKGIPNCRIFIAHYCHRVWPESHYGAWHLFGHSHCSLNEYVEDEGKLLDVGVDCHDFYPWSLEEVVEVMKDKPLNCNDITRMYTPIDH